MEKRLVRRGFVNFEGNEYCAVLLHGIEGRYVEVIPDNDPVTLLYVFLNGCLFCVATRVVVSHPAFPGRPMLKGREERQIRMAGRKYEQLRQVSADTESDAMVRSMLLTIQNGIDSLIQYLDTKAQDRGL